MFMQLHFESLTRTALLLSALGAALIAIAAAAPGAA